MASLFGSLFRGKKTEERLGMTNKPGQLRALSAEELLETPSRKAILNNIRALMSLPDKHYDALIGQLFKNYALFVQQLPATQRHHHAMPGGLLDHSLEITLTALLIRRGFMLPIGSSPEVLARKQDIWSYATLTGALLKNVGVALVQQMIGLYDAHGKWLGHWSPIKESLGKHLFYDVSFVTDAPTSLGARMTPLIAQMLVPIQGILWLYEDKLVFNHWLAVLSWDVAGAGILGQMIDRANKENIQKHSPPSIAGPAPTPSPQPAQPRLTAPPPMIAPPESLEAAIEEAPAEEKEDVSFDDIRGRLAALLGGDGEETNQTSSQQDENLVSLDEVEEPTQGKEKQGKERMQASSVPSDLGDFFIQWARQGLASGHIACNREKSHVHRVQEGVFLAFPGLFQLFCDEHPDLEMQPTTVQKRFQRLKLHVKKREENICSYASYETGKRVVMRGYLIADPKVLFDAEKIPPINTKLELNVI